MTKAVNRDGLAHFDRRPIPSRVPLSEAPRDIDGLLLAATPRHRHSLGWAARYIGSIRRYGDRRKSMRPIPGDGISVGVLEIAWRWLRRIYHGLNSRRPVVEAPYRRPEGPEVVSPVMPERLRRRPVGNRMRSKPATRRRSGPGGCLVRGKHERRRTERREKRPIHFIGHGTHHFVGCRAILQRTLGRAFRARKRIINY